VAVDELSEQLNQIILLTPNEGLSLGHLSEFIPALKRKS